MNLSFFLVASLMLSMTTTITLAADSNRPDTTTTTATALEPWQECSIFVAPSWTGGFGVYAARDFAANEIVELAPFFVLLDHDHPAVTNAALQDYVYSMVRKLPKGTTKATMTMTMSESEDNENENDNDDEVVMSAVVWGMTMWYNHHSTAPNVQWNDFGIDPDPNDPSSSYQPHIVKVAGFHARRDIVAGEELFSSYGDDDGGAQWFEGRNIVMATAKTTEEVKLDAEKLAKYQSLYCSKMYASIDRFLFANLVQPIMDRYGQTTFLSLDRLAPQPLPSNFMNLYYDDPEYPWAMAKVPIHAGERIELAPALVLDISSVVNSPLAPTVITWDALSPELQEEVKLLRKRGYYKVQYQGNLNGWERSDNFTSFEASVIFPVAGLIGRVRRVGNDSNLVNAKLHIQAAVAPSSETDSGSASSSSSSSSLDNRTTPAASDSVDNAGIALELVATRDIAVGERIFVNLPPPTATLRERILLLEEMKRSGQIFTVDLNVLAPPLNEHDHDDDDDKTTTPDRDEL